MAHDFRRLPISPFRTSLEFPLWCAFHRLANREKEHGTLVFPAGRKEVSHVIVEKGQPGRTQMLRIRCQVHPAADGPCLKTGRPGSRGSRIAPGCGLNRLENKMSTQA